MGWRTKRVKIGTEITLVVMKNQDWQLFFFNDTATTEIYTLSLHDALPISIISDVRTTPRID